MTEIEKLIQGLQQDLNQLRVAVKNVSVQKPKTGRAKRSEQNKIKLQSKI